MRIANCTTAAQYFHLLRRQAALLQVDPLPLVVLTPKSLLRHAAVASAPRDFAEGRFRMVLQDEQAATRADVVRRVLVCSGKVYVDLIASDHRAARQDVAICRVEQLYPVPMRDLRAMIDVYANADEVVWVQEEPREHGRVGLHPSAPAEAARRPHRPRVARPRSASPAEGSARATRVSSRRSSRQAFGAVAPRPTQRGRNRAGSSDEQKGFAAGLRSSTVTGFAWLEF